MEITCVPSEAYALMKNLIRDLDIHLVRAYGGYWPSDFATNSSVAGVPIIVSVHDTNPLFLHDSVKYADYVLAISRPVLTLLHKRGIERDKIHMFSNRIDLNKFKPIEGEENTKKVELLKRKYPGKYRILFIGRLYIKSNGIQKNWDTLIKSLKYLGNDYTLIMIGSGGVKDKEAVMKLAKETNVEKQIFLIESVSNDELRYYYSMVDVFCTPSRWEGFGIVFIESLAMGVVTITSNISPMNLYIKNGVNGILVNDYENPKELGHAIVEGTTDEEIRNTLRQNARASIQKFGRQNVDKWEVLLYKYFLHKTYAAGTPLTDPLKSVERAKEQMKGF